MKQLKVDAYNSVTVRRKQFAFALETFPVHQKPKVRRWERQPIALLPDMDVGGADFRGRTVTVQAALPCSAYRMMRVLSQTAFLVRRTEV
jgi:uncharacterized protein YmfQ (DUF2313 family)